MEINLTAVFVFIFTVILYLMLMCSTQVMIPPNSRTISQCNYGYICTFAIILPFTMIITYLFITMIDQV